MCKGLLLLVLVIGFLELYSSAPIKTPADGTAPRLEQDLSGWEAILFYLFVSFWIVVFVNALYQFIVAYGVAEYYYTPYDHDNEKDVGCCALWDGVYFGMVTHGGSLAMGSFLIATLTFIQMILKAARDASAENQVVACILCLINLCVGCCKDRADPTAGSARAHASGWHMGNSKAAPMLDIRLARDLGASMAKHGSNMSATLQRQGHRSGSGHGCCISSSMTAEAACQRKQHASGMAATWKRHGKDMGATLRWAT